MRVVATVRELREACRALPGDTGFVPTMGYLHAGHLALVGAARERDDHVIVSIFVNPTQFGPGEDYERYPRNTERDLALLERERVDVVFVPSVDEMYPPGDSTVVEVAGLTEVLEGAHRPGHFRGVTTVVAKLLNIVQPRRVYFGRKDAQQLVVVRRLVRDLHLDVEVVPVDTVREPDGLALSSRNAYLTSAEREAALVLSRALRAAAGRFAAGERDAGRLRAAMREEIAREALARIDYVSVADPETLGELDRVDACALASVAVRIGSVRLIDNVTLGSQRSDP
jgi:pantoate--beta-alanine ligase